MCVYIYIYLYIDIDIYQKNPEALLKELSTAKAVTIRTK